MRLTQLRPAAFAALAAVSTTLAACGGSDSTPGSTRTAVPIDGAPSRGPADAWVTIVEYGDYQCSYCKAEAPALTALLAAYPADLRLVYKQFPLPAYVHPRARPAALAAMCAEVQGYFWEAHDLLYAQAEGLGDAAIEGYVTAAGVDLQAWRGCIGNLYTWDRLDDGVAAAARLGVGATPTMFVNGVKYEGAGSVTAGIIEAARAEAIASGVARDRYYDQVVLGL